MLRPLPLVVAHSKSECFISYSQMLLHLSVQCFVCNSIDFCCTLLDVLLCSNASLLLQQGLILIAICSYICCPIVQIRCTFLNVDSMLHPASLETNCCTFGIIFVAPDQISCLVLIHSPTKPTPPDPHLTSQRLTSLRQLKPAAIVAMLLPVHQRGEDRVSRLLTARGSRRCSRFRSLLPVVSPSSNEGLEERDLMVGKVGSK